MELPQTKPAELLASFHPAADRLLYNTLVMLAWLLDRISPGHHWKKRLLELIERHAVKSEFMGFPDGFEQRAIWQLVDKGPA